MQVMRQASKRKSGLRSWSRALGIAVFALVFTASHAQAVPFTGAAQAFWTVTQVPGPDAPLLLGIATSRGYTTTGGAIVCNGIQTHFEIPEEPTGACREGELESAIAWSYYCQLEGAEDIFHSTSTGTGCATISSCFDENFFYQVGCTYTITESVTAAGGSGIAAGSSGSWTSSSTGTFTQVEPFIAGTASVELEGDFELADGSVAPDGAFLENPSPGANVSGIGVISGWSCLGGELEVELSDADGVIETMTVLQGSERLDTEPTCGDIHNGFSSLYNWSRLGDGEKTARLIRNGEEISSSTFFVTTFGEEFVTGAEGMCTIADFPDMGKNATFVWEQSQQSLVLESLN